jgi:3-hydroxyacyl-CoA dehydrogenase
MKTSIVGCGLVGRAWAIGFPRGGYEVALFDANRDAVKTVLEFIDMALEALAERRLWRDRRLMALIAHQRASE